MRLIKILRKKYCSGLVENVDLIFKIVCQISGQDNVAYVTNPGAQPEIRDGRG